MSTTVPALADREVAAADDALLTLVTAVQELSRATTVMRVQEIVRTAARRLTRADGATFVLRDVDKCFYVDEDAIAPLWKGERFPLEACISGWAMLNRTHVVIEDIYADDRIPHDAYRPTFVKSLVMVPIRTVDPIGAIGIYWADRHHATELEVGLARALADSTAVALGHVQTLGALDDARRLSETDTLTGIANRRAWDNAVAVAVADPRLTAWLLALDLDHFKEFNDRCGHQAGDDLLRETARSWGAVLRDGDLLARTGGEEFGVLLADVTRAQALEIAERLRVAVPGRQTVSIGLAAWDGREDARALTARADAALYRAKSDGRDRAGVAP